MKTLKIFLFSFMFISAFSHAGEKKAMFDLTSGDAERIEQRIVGAIKFLSNYYKKQGDEFKAVVVISGKSYKYFIQDLDNSPYKGDKELAAAQKKLQPMLLELHEKYGVRFDMCGGGMKSRDIKAESLYSYVHTDKMKYVYLINWQNEGYAYLSI